MKDKIWWKIFRIITPLPWNMQRPENWEHKTDINSDFEENNKFLFVLTHTSCILLLLFIIIKSSTQRFYLIFIFTEKYIVGILCITDQLFQDTSFHLHVFDQNQSFQKFELNNSFKHKVYVGFNLQPPLPSLPWAFMPKYNLNVTRVVKTLHISFNLVLMKW